jgi:hypothetical protein
MVYFDVYKQPTAAASTVGLPAESGPQLISYYLGKIRGSIDLRRAVLQKHPELIERWAAEQQTQAACKDEDTQPVSQTRFNKVLVALAMMYRKKIPTALSYRTAARYGSEAYGVSVSHENVERYCANDCRLFEAPGRQILRSLRRAQCARRSESDPATIWRLTRRSRPTTTTYPRRLSPTRARRVRGMPKAVRSCFGGVSCAQGYGSGRPFSPHMVRFYDLSKFVLGAPSAAPQGGQGVQPVQYYTILSIAVKYDHGCFRVAE